MIKKITLILILCFVIISCGKKADPKYNDKELEQKAKIQNFLINKA
jgi:hypothetical protein